MTTKNEVFSPVNNDAITRALYTHMSAGELSEDSSPARAFGIGWLSALLALVNITEEEKATLLKDVREEHAQNILLGRPNDVPLTVLNNILNKLTEDDDEDETEVEDEKTIVEEVTFTGSSSQIGAIQTWLDGGEYRMGIGTQDINDKALLTINRSNSTPRLITIHRGDTITKDHHGVITVTLAKRKERRES